MKTLEITVTRCFDKYYYEILEGDFIDVQIDPIMRRVYKKEDGELYFSPYEKEEKYLHILRMT